MEETLSRSCQGLLAAALTFGALTVTGCSTEEPGTNAETGTNAVWDLAGSQTIDASSKSFIAIVNRLECSGGETGEVLPPKVELQETKIVVTFSVAALREGFYTCQGNLGVPYAVQLDEPIGGRALIDGACLETRAEGTSFCKVGSTRWPPH